MTRVDAVCWGVGRSRDANGKWWFQGAVFGRRPRRDGMPLWVRVGVVGSPHTDPNAARDSAVEALGAHPAWARLPLNDHAMTNGLAAQLSDLLQPDEETLVRLGSGVYRLFYEQGRTGMQVGLGKLVTLREAYPDARVVPDKGDAWVLVRRIGRLARKQREGLTSLGISVESVAKLPRKPGKPIKMVVSKSRARR